MNSVNGIVHEFGALYDVLRCSDIVICRESKELFQRYKDIHKQSPMVDRVITIIG